MNNEIVHLRQYFLSLIEEIRRTLGYAIRKEELHSEEDVALEMMYGGFSFALVHSPKNCPKKILLECTFGDIPEENNQAILLNLLNMNAAIAEIDTSAFCIDPDSEQLIFTISLDLQAADANYILRKMTETVWHGRRWIDSRFIKMSDTRPNNIVDLNILA